MKAEIKLKAEIKAKWVKALRSGKYKQAVGALKCDTGYCCLGVLCNLHSKQADDKLKWMSAPTALSGRMKYGASSTYPPKRVFTWAGLHHSTGVTLAGLNDDKKMTFKEIADYIEKRL